jgi:CheY-like chemotaxis protein
MKKILVACDRAQLDVSLRRSLAHLVQSCDINVVHNGYAAFDELSAQPFDLIVADFLLPGIDSLELVESIQYIDPGVPVILIVKQDHKSVQDTARYLKAHPITHPFKPLRFLRLVDKLLHQQLNRYRQLASILETVLDRLCQQSSTPCAFLVENNGQILLSKGEIGETLLETLGNLAVGISLLDEELERLFAQDETLRIHYQQAQKDYGLFVVPVIDNLRLALLSPIIEPQEPKELWQWMRQAAFDTKQALNRYSQETSPAEDDNGKEASEEEDQVTLQDYVFIPLSLDDIDETPAETTKSEESGDDEEDEDEVAVNWQILSNNSKLLTRLKDLSQPD